jgi:hypothetical protein
MAAAFAVAALIIVVCRLVSGPGERMALALRTTARWSFVLFWPATAGSALATLFGMRFETLARRARDLGLSFASAHLAHLALVAWVYYYAVVHSLEPPSLAFFGVAAGWVYLIALLSFKPAAALVGARVVRVLRIVGIEFITVAFLVDFLKNPFGGGAAHVALYAPFVVLCGAGPLLRLAAAIKRAARPGAQALGT